MVPYFLFPNYEILETLPIVCTLAWVGFLYPLQWFWPTFNFPKRTRNNKKHQDHVLIPFLIFCFCNSVFQIHAAIDHKSNKSNKWAALWHRGLSPMMPESYISTCSSPTYSTSTQLLVNVCRKAGEHGPSAVSLTPSWKTKANSWFLVSALFSPSQCSHLENERMNGKYSPTHPVTV